MFVTAPWIDYGPFVDLDLLMAKSGRSKSANDRLLRESRTSIDDGTAVAVELAALNSVRHLAIRLEADLVAFVNRKPRRRPPTPLPTLFEPLFPGMEHGVPRAAPGTLANALVLAMLRGGFEAPLIGVDKELGRQLWLLEPYILSVQDDQNLRRDMDVGTVAYSIVAGGDVDKLQSQVALLGQRLQAAGDMWTSHYYAINHSARTQKLNVAGRYGRSAHEVNESCEQLADVLAGLIETIETVTERSAIIYSGCRVEFEGSPYSGFGDEPLDTAKRVLQHERATPAEAPLAL